MSQKLKWNVFGRKFEYHCKVVTPVTQLLITQDTDFCQQGTEKLIPQYDKMPHLWQGLHGKVVG